VMAMHVGATVKFLDRAKVFRGMRSSHLLVSDKRYISLAVPQYSCGSAPPGDAGQCPAARAIGVVSFVLPSNSATLVEDGYRSRKWWTLLSWPPGAQGCL
jgi:hypothetical protein